MTAWAHITARSDPNQAHLAGDVHPSFTSMLITVEVNAHLGYGHPGPPAKNANCLGVFLAHRHLLCDRRGLCVRVFPGATCSLETSAPRRSAATNGGRLCPGSSSSFPREACAGGLGLSLPHPALLGSVSPFLGEMPSLLPPTS